MTVTKKRAGWRPEAPDEYGTASSIFVSFNMVLFWLYWQSFWPWLAAKRKYSLYVNFKVLKLKRNTLMKNVWFLPDFYFLFLNYWTVAYTMGLLTCTDLFVCIDFQSPAGYLNRRSQWNSLIYGLILFWLFCQNKVRIKWKVLKI